MLPYVVAKEIHAEPITKLVNSAYRGESGLQGWTTETEYLDGQRIDPSMFVEMLRVDSRVLVFGPENEPIACVYIEKRANQVYIGMLTVSPKFQAKGIGSFVLQTAENFAKKEWSSTVALMTVISKRKELLAFYERRGYHDTGNTEAFPYGQVQYGIPKQDDLIFVKIAKQLI